MLHLSMRYDGVYIALAEHLDLYGVRSLQLQFTSSRRQIILTMQQNTRKRSTIYKNSIEKRDNRSYSFWSLSEKLADVGNDVKFNLQYRMQCTYSFPKSTKEVFNLQGELHSPNTLSNIVYDSVFRIKLASSLSRRLPLSTTWGCAQQLFGFEHW